MRLFQFQAVQKANHSFTAMFSNLRLVIGKFLQNPRSLEPDISHCNFMETYQSLSYVNPIIILLMADVISKIEDESFIGVPQSRASHGCPFENSRLQSNLMGEQGCYFSEYK